MNRNKANTSVDGSQDHLVFDFTDELITGLQRFREFPVGSQNASMEYGNSKLSANEYATSLVASYRVEGSIKVEVAGDLGEFMRLTVVPAGSPDSTAGPQRTLQQGTKGGGVIRRLPKEPGEYEIRCASSNKGKQVYARHKLMIQ